MRLTNVKSVTSMPYVSMDTVNANMASMVVDISAKKKRKNLSAGVAAHLLSVKMEFVFAWNITLETDITVNLSSRAATVHLQTFVFKAAAYLHRAKSQR